MTKIKFGTDGWRAIIAKDFTVDNVARVTEAVVLWLRKVEKSQKGVVIGYDCRFGGKLFAETVAKVLGEEGIKVYLSDRIVSTPMVSLGTLELGAALGVVLTASHNPPDYNGYKLKGEFGGPLLSHNVDEVEALIPDKHKYNLENISLEEFRKKGLVKDVDLEAMYIKKVEANFDLDLIKKSNLNFAYDAMYGAGQFVMRKLLPDITFLHCDYNPGFDGTAPEPIHRNLVEFSELIKTAGDIDCGLATDGDADRLGFYNSKGEFVDSHHIILLLITYLRKYKKMDGKVVIAFSVSDRIKKLCKHLGLEVTTTKIGFKYVCDHLINEDVLLGGEESGGVAIKGHIPERDGVWMGLTIWEYMAKTGKTLDDLVQEVYEIVGAFAFERIDLHISESIKQKVMENCKSGAYTEFAGRKITRREDIDGFKFFFGDDEWLMIRPSGTEPVLRTYCESSSSKEAFSLLEKSHKLLLN
ncbi:MAG: phosphoglucomutase/phosphomannomutase family protein [Flavobacteriales bacterium]